MTVELDIVHNLAGKDYFTVPEAAHYACISVSHWRARVQPEFPAGQFKGKLIYRRSDVARYIEQNTRWPLGTRHDAYLAKGRPRGPGRG